MVRCGHTAGRLESAGSSSVAELPRRLYPSRYRPVHGDGFSLGVFSQRKRWAYTRDGRDKFTDNALSLWAARRISVLSISIYVALPLVAGYFSRRWIIAVKGEQWFRERFLHFLTPVTIIALLITLVLLFSFKGEVILSNPLTILWIAIPLFIQTNVIFWLAYGLAKILKLEYRDAAPSAMIGASNHFEVAIATATMLFGLSSGAALATVVGVLIEVPVMLMLVKICLRTQNWFKTEAVT